MVNRYKEERRRLKELRRKQKKSETKPEIFKTFDNKSNGNHSIAFVLGNGTSRSSIDPSDLTKYGKIYGCNALYRSFVPDYLVAVDSKMIFEIAKAGYQNNHTVWTNPNKSYKNITNLNYFNPSKGWSSGPTALWLASEHVYKEIYILGFDYQGLNNGKLVNNIYAGTQNYKKIGERATFFGNWLKQTIKTVESHKNIKYIRVIDKDGHIPKDLTNIENLKHITIEDFQKKFIF